MRPFILKGGAPDTFSAAAGASGIAALEHEGFYIAVEAGAVVITRAGEVDEVPDCVGGVLGEEGEG